MGAITRERSGAVNGRGRLNKCATHPLSRIFDLDRKFFKMNSFYQTTTILVAMSFLAGCTQGVITNDLAPTTTYDLETQGWNKANQALWFRATGGSRLIPQSWFKALEQPDNVQPFLHWTYFSQFGYLDGSGFDDTSLPLGFASDRQSDTKFIHTKLRWYEGQKGRPRKQAEPWVGLTCGACHTSHITYNSRTTRILGASSNGDIQLLIRELIRALRKTVNNPSKWSRFASRILGDRNNHTNQNMLFKAVHTWITRIETTTVPERQKLQHGPGRVDAFAHIMNSAQLFVDAKNPIYYTLEAPVNYPFLWNSHKQRRIQWNGFAINNVLPREREKIIDISGAILRDSTSFIGTYGEVAPKANPVLGTGYNSSLNLRNISKHEDILLTLRPPKWPTHFPALNQTKIKRGALLFQKYCQDCHLDPNIKLKKHGTERMIEFSKIPKRHITDVAMACNVVSYVYETGKLEGSKRFFLTGNRLNKQEPGYALFTAILAGAIFDRIASVPSGIPRFIIRALTSKNKLPDPADYELITGNASERHKKCETSENPFLAYKARPLDGIWATAPYLHNGSVPSLYDLLLPAAKRPKTFYLGHTEFDARKVGVSQARNKQQKMFLFRARDKFGYPIPGNGNQGHEYGVDQLTETDRWALVEYLKSL